MNSTQEKPPEQPDPHDEAVCRKCGKCCRKKLLVGERVIYLPHYCEYLDAETMLCTIYEKRSEVNPGCKRVPEAIKLRILPADCAYVQGIPDYEAPLEGWDTPEANEVLERFIEEYRSGNNLTDQSD